MARDITISLHVSQDTKSKLQDAALEEDRSVNDLINHWLHVALEMREVGISLRMRRNAHKPQTDSE